MSVNDSGRHTVTAHHEAPSLSVSNSKSKPGEHMRSPERSHGTRHRVSLGPSTPGCGRALLLPALAPPRSFPPLCRPGVSGRMSHSASDSEYIVLVCSHLVGIHLFPHENFKKTQRGRWALGRPSVAATVVSFIQYF